MDQVYALLKLFGERYIFCDDAQAEADAMPENREELVSAYASLMEYVRLKGGE